MNASNPTNASRLYPTVSAYLARVGLERRPPSLAALTRLQVHHPERVPFENLDIHLGVPIRLDEGSLVTEILAGRGGFCYELNGAFAWLLRGLGYDVTLLEARVAAKDGRFGIPFDHLTLRVDLDRPYLVDVGAGDCFVEPLPLVDDASSTQGTREYRLRPLDNGLVLERRRPGEEWSAEYSLTPTPRRLADFEPGCHHPQTFPASSFTRRPICTRLDGDAWVTFHQDRLTRGDRSILVSSSARWTELLESHFGIVLDGPPVDGPAAVLG